MGRIVEMSAHLRPASSLQFEEPPLLSIAIAPIPPGTEGVPDASSWAWAVIASHAGGFDEILVGGGAQSATEAAANAEVHLERFRMLRAQRQERR